MNLNEFTSQLPAMWEESRFRPEPVLPARHPCRDCQHAARCARESLACCAYMSHVESSGVRRMSHREPSRAWFEAVFDGAQKPHCEECAKRPVVVRVPRAKNGTHEPALQSRVLEFLSEQSCASVPDIAESLGIRATHTRKAIIRLARKGLVECAGEVRAKQNRSAKLWRAV